MVEILGNLSKVGDGGGIRQGTVQRPTKEGPIRSGWFFLLHLRLGFSLKKGIARIH